MCTFGRAGGHWQALCADMHFEDSRPTHCTLPPAMCRRCRWVRASTAQRLAGDRVARFERDNRGADSVEPKVQPQWLQVCVG